MEPIRLRPEQQVEVVVATHIHFCQLKQLVSNIDQDTFDQLAKRSRMITLATEDLQEREVIGGWASPSIWSTASQPEPWTLPHALFR